MKPLSKGESYREEKICGGVLLYRNEPLEKWKCRVRLHTGEVVEAVYDHPSLAEKCHWVEIDGIAYFARSKIKETDDCRFVGPACVLLPVGVSV